VGNISCIRVFLILLFFFVNVKDHIICIIPEMFSGGCVLSLLRRRLMAAIQRRDQSIDDNDESVMAVNGSTYNCYSCLNKTFDCRVSTYRILNSPSADFTQYCRSEMNDHNGSVLKESEPLSILFSTIHRCLRCSSASGRLITSEFIINCIFVIVVRAMSSLFGFSRCNVD